MNPHEWDTRVPFKLYSCQKSNLTVIPVKGPNYPPGDSIRITRGLHPTGALVRTLWRIAIPLGRLYLNHPGAQGLHPSGALMRTLWQVKIPLRRLYLNHPRARGLLSGT